MVQRSTWLLTQPSLALSQESCSRPCAPAGASAGPGPRAGPGDLIVLKHSSYPQIFQCPLSLVSDIYICWNTVGCLLCSSDQLGVSLALRGSGLCSYLSRRHLPTDRAGGIFQKEKVKEETPGGCLGNSPAAACLTSSQLSPSVFPWWRGRPRGHTCSPGESTHPNLQV